MKNNRGFLLTGVMFVIGIIIISGLTNNIVNSLPCDRIKNENYCFDFSKPEIVENEIFNKIIFKETNSFLSNEQKPKIPFYAKTYEFPLGTKIVNIMVNPLKINRIHTNKYVEPVPSFRKIGDEISIHTNIIDSELYNCNEPYPPEWISYNMGIGLNSDNNRVLFLSLQIFPARYIPLEESIEYTNRINVEITYEEPEKEIIKSTVGDYELVIISPNEFSNELSKLIKHKNDYGIKTILITLEEIYRDFTGRDKAEKIKYFIKHAIEKWNTKFVLLVGDIKKLPIRTTHASFWEPDILSDLYYADIYDYDYRFCSWDANENNKFGEIEIEGNFNDIDNVDEVDLYADVHIGRLACTNDKELETVVDKIMIYENYAYDQLWFNKIVLAGGDTFPPRRGSPFFVFEGEITNRKIMQQLPYFEHVRLWASRRNLNAMTFNRAISRGAGFVSYSGHGFEHGWGTYRPNSLKKKMDLTQPLYYTPFIKNLRNKNKLPIIFFDACLTAKLDFNITDLEEYYSKFIKFLVLFTKLDYDPSHFYPCFAWSFVVKENGGAIATIGSTRTAYTWVDKDGVYAGAGYLNVQFFKSYNEGVSLGEMFTQAQNNYMNNAFKDYFTIEEFILLGDPSLRVGGYP